MMTAIKKLLGIGPRDTTDLELAAKEAQQLSRMARSERTEKLFQTIIAEVKK